MLDGQNIAGLKKSQLRAHIGMVSQDNSLFNLTIRENLLFAKPDASDDEVRRAYRKMALQYHPDRVAMLGDDIHESATRKFQEINDAKERIFKQRGL
mgnify:CR=1 FL=1